MPKPPGKLRQGPEPSEGEKKSDRDWLAANAGRILQNQDSTGNSYLSAPDIKSDYQNWHWKIFAVALVVLIVSAVISVGGKQYLLSQQENARMRDSIASTSTLELQHNQLQATVEALIQENQALREQVHKLQIELDIRDLYLTASEPDLTAGEFPDLKSPTPRTEQALAEARPQGEWFVNFGSYFNPDTARAWSERLTPSSGRVTISTAGPEDRRLYRLRIVGLATREEAETMASKLEEEYKLDKLWVGNR